MENNYMLVHKSIVPPYYEIVIKAKEMIEGEGQSVSEVCKKLNISRSTYYKYKDYVFYPNNDNQKRAIISFKTIDSHGVLSKIISLISENNCNVLTINQNIPIHNMAFITIMIDFASLEMKIEDLILELRKIQDVKGVEVLAYE